MNYKVKTKAGEAGPYPVEIVKELLQAGKLKPETNIWCVERNCPVTVAEALGLRKPAPPVQALPPDPAPTADAAPVEEEDESPFADADAVAPEEAQTPERVTTSRRRRGGTGRAARGQRSTGRVARTDDEAEPGEDAASVLEPLRRVSGWLLLLAILGFIGSGAGVLGSLAIGFAALGVGALGSMGGAAVLVLVALLYLALSGASLWLAVQVLRAANGFQRLRQSPRQGARAVRSLAGAIRFLGILIIASFILGIVMGVAMAATGASAALAARTTSGENRPPVIFPASN